MTHLVAAWCLAVLLAGCATLPSALNPRMDADQIAASAGLQKRYIAAGAFDICTYGRIGRSGEPLTVYIEGDGLAWKSRGRLSGDPTPLHAMVLRLAAADPALNVVYVARPGQYLIGGAQRSVSPSYWSDRRFSDEVITAVDAVIDSWVKESRAGQVHLVGFSGGGAAAVLIAARRTDVATLRTVAGNLDTQLVSRIHRVSPLAGSLDPRLYAAQVASIPQNHFVGANDRIIPASVAESFKAAAGRADCIQIRVVEGAGHRDGWVERWPALLAESVRCAP